MPKEKSSLPSDNSRKRKKRSSDRPIKFIPNLSQLNEAAKELPDPEIWPESNYLCLVEVEGKQHNVEFILKPISRGSKQAPRWIYDGKVLIRKRDN